MLKNADITVINIHKDRAGSQYYKTQISGVWWYGGVLKSVGDKGLSNAETYRISIYEDSVFQTPYLPPKEWEKLADKSAAWTLKPGDYICRGNVVEEIETPSDFLSQYETAKIIGVKDLRFGLLPYWRIEGK